MQLGSLFYFLIHIISNMIPKFRITIKKFPSENGSLTLVCPVCPSSVDASMWEIAKKDGSWDAEDMKNSRPILARFIEEVMVSARKFSLDKLSSMGMFSETNTRKYVQLIDFQDGKPDLYYHITIDMFFDFSPTKRENNLKS